MSAGLEIGVGIANYGSAPDAVGIGAMARAVEDAGFDAVWLTDHVVLPRHTDSRYPFTADGHFSVPAGGVWYEPVATLAYLVGVTRRVRLGIGIVVLPLRDPRHFAVQLAAVDRLSAGRVQLGVGAGWLEEEFKALEIPFAGRGERLDGAIDLVRACWTGDPKAGRYGPFTMPDGMTSLPAPRQEHITLLIAGSGERTLDRITARGDGWFGAVSVSGEPGPEEVAGIRRSLGRRFAAAGRDPDLVQMALRVAVTSRALERGAVAQRLGEYAAAGLSKLIVDFGWKDLEQGTRVLNQLRRDLSAIG